MPKATVNIYLRKDGRYEGRYLKRNTNKKTKYGYVYGATYEETYIKLLQKKEAYEKELFFYGKRTLTMEGLMKAWLFSICDTVKPSTFSTYQNYVNTYLLPKVGSMYALEFDKNIVETILISLQKESTTGKISENTLYLLEEIIHLAFKYGQENNMLPAMELGKVVNYKKNKKEVLFLSRQERERLLETIQQKEMDIQISALLPLYTGINLSELCGLKWKDLDLEQGRIRIVRSVKRVQNYKEQKKSPTSLVEYDLKKEECREFYLPESILKLLQKVSDFTGVKTVEDFNRNFKTKVGDEELETYIVSFGKKQPEGRTLQYRLAHIGMEAGIYKLNFRMLRDTFAIRCLQAGGDIYNLAYILGIGVSMACERYEKWIVKDDGILKRIG